MMSAFFLALLACALAVVAGRDQLRTARLAAGLGPGPGLFAAIWASALLTSLVAAWLAQAVSPTLSSAARMMFVAMALALAGVEVLVLRPGKKPAEPTRSVGAIFLVLSATQLTDAARFLVLALAVATGDPWPAALGGAIGSGAALSVAALAGAEWERRVPLGVLRWTIAALLLLAAIITAISARGILG